MRASLDEVPAALRDGADLVLDGGVLPGTPSTVIDLRDYERSGEFTRHPRGRRERRGDP